MNELDFGELIAKLIAHGLSDNEIVEQLAEEVGWDDMPEFLVAWIRVHMTKGCTDGE